MFNRNTRDDGLLTKWLGKSLSEINVAATYNLLYNASLMVKEGLGYSFALDKIINTAGDSGLRFLPCQPELKAEMCLIWKKYQIFPKAAEKFLETIQDIASSRQGGQR